jgi:type IV pilus assembly protein PilB
MARTPLGQLLVLEGKISETQLRSALSHQERWRSRLGESLVALGYLPEQSVLATVAKQMGVACVEVGDRTIPPAILALIPERVCRARHVLPVAVVHRGVRQVLAVAVTDAADLGGIDEVAFAAGMEIQPVLASRRDVDRAIDRHFEGLKDRMPRAVDLPPDPGPMQIVARGHQKN